MLIGMKLVFAFVLAVLRPHTRTNAQQPPANDEWWYSVCRGSRLNQAMVWPPPYANDFLNPIDSPWDGVMHQELAQWGYTESERSQLCDYGTFWGLGRAFESLGIDPRSNFNHGPNRCFRVSHGDATRRWPDGRLLPLAEQTYMSPNGRSRRVTGAFSDIGVNPDAGIVFFMSRRSVVESAKLLWRQDPPSWRDLPALRSSSDFAWAFWNRVPHFTPIKAFWSVSVNNRQTLNILNLAFKTYKPPLGRQKVNRIQDWPGTDFEIASTEALAILGKFGPFNIATDLYASKGSPIGIAAGFFLAQHKRQLGGNKMIFRITVFKAVQPVTNDDFPTIIFWVQDARNIYGDVNGAQSANVSGVAGIGHMGGFGEPKVLKRSADGKSVVREHVVRVEL